MQLIQRQKNKNTELSFVNLKERLPGRERLGG